MALQNPLIPVPGKPTQRQRRQRQQPQLASPPPTWPGCVIPWTPASPITPGPCTTPPGAPSRPGPRPGATMALPASPAVNRRLPGPPGRGTPNVGGPPSGSTKAALAAIHKAARPPTTPPTTRASETASCRASRGPTESSRSKHKPLTAEALAAVKATARGRRQLGGPGKRQESAERASWRGTGGRGPAGHPAGRVIEKVGGRGPDLGRRGVPGTTAPPCCSCAGPRPTKRRRAW